MISIKEHKRELKEYLKRKEETSKPKRYAPSLAEGKIHLVTLNSAQILKQLGWNSETERIFKFVGHYNQEKIDFETQTPVRQVYTPKHKETVLKQLVYEYRFRWNARVEDVWDKAYTLEQILEIVEDEGASDITFSELGVLIKYPTTIIYQGFPESTFNIGKRIFKRWSFNPSSFEKRGASPSELRVYQTFREVITKLFNDVPIEVLKRRRATVMVNEGSDILNLSDALKIIKFRPWVLVLQQIGRYYRIITLEEIELGERKGWQVM
jgi:hypothetical protein